MDNPVVELDGDEMARVIWRAVRENLIRPFVDLKTEYFDLSIQNRDSTSDQVTRQAAAEIKRLGVGIKCATITPDEGRVREFGLKRMWASPNGTIRNVLGGAIFREPIVCPGLPRPVPGWTKPIVVARHAFADQYLAGELAFTGRGRVVLRFEPEDPSVQPGEIEICRPGGRGVAMGMFNLDSSIADFARGCLRYALQRSLPVYFSTKNTILKGYDGRFKEIFAAVFEAEFREAFAGAGLTYEHRLIDDMAAWMLKSSGGYLWACKNYDGDVMSDVVAQGYGSLGMMTSVLFSPDGRTVLSEAAHGTVTRHFRRHQMGEPTSTNPVASIFAWSRGLFHRGRLDGNQPLKEYSAKLEECCLAAVRGGAVTKDLTVAPLSADSGGGGWLTTDEFIAAVREGLEARL